jgi:hypothetical protein
MFLKWVSPEKTSLHIHLYGDALPKALNLGGIARYIEDKLGGASVDLKKSFFTGAGPTTELPRELAKARVSDFSAPSVAPEPSEAEVGMERELANNPDLVGEVFYDGLRLHSFAQRLLSGEKSDFQHVHVIFTSRLFGTWDGADGRYHARVCILGYPNLISTTGVVEAPAKPTRFYRLKREGVGDAELRKRFRGEFIDHNDPRLTEVLKGYAMQAIFYHLTLEPFCREPSCRLFNSHWQKEILRAQLTEPEFCPRHERMLEEWKKFSR